MHTPASLCFALYWLLLLPLSEEWMTPLMSSVVLFFACMVQHMLVSSHNNEWCCPQACSAMADFSISLCQLTAFCLLCSVFVSPIYIQNCKGSGTQLPTSSPVGLGSWPSSAVCGGWMLILRLFGCCSYLLHARLTLCSGLLYWGCINAVARGSSVALSLYVWGLLSISTKASGYPFPSRSPLRWSSSACIVSRVIHRGKSRRPYPLSLGLSGERWSSGIGVWVAFQ